MNDLQYKTKRDWYLINENYSKFLEICLKTIGFIVFIMLLLSASFLVYKYIMADTNGKTCYILTNIDFPEYEKQKLYILFRDVEWRRDMLLGSFDSTEEAIKFGNINGCEIN